MFGPDPTTPLNLQLMSSKTWARYYRLRRWVSVSGVVAFGGFLILPKEYAKLSYSFFAAAVLLVIAAVVLERLADREAAEIKRKQARSDSASGRVH